MSTRSVVKVVDAVQTLEGEGFLVRRPFPIPGFMQFDPFLLLDEMGPVELPPGEGKGAPDHPHRGFETVSYILEGRHEHRDSAGNAGELGPGDVQWMTAGAGVVHSEMPAREFARKGGRMHGFQVWVNLPRRDKMMSPRYQEVPAARIPVASSPDGKVRVKVIAGESLGARAVIDTRTPIQYLHFTLEPGGHIEQPVPRDHNAFAYVFGGEGTFDPEGRHAADGQAVLFANDAESVVMTNTGSEPLQVLLLSGVPLREPMVRYGPFVMNTQTEILQAFEDYQSGRMGRIQP
ncbi:pirin family protein [Vitiosangium sp. GDMCC 1.1324]|uniref:pirin family protein n=1 Tax=Vitiosangium sp. (strain GDMCC 1.1324) TaxID=2138576 RepID=UPI000D3A6956|nr:pirin family protein [Vitiosangium sp. GDMCC 1.1324]PTL77967.1 pirin family protein [Vitiosangium sp. GDMCC 1.1324]